MPKVAEVHLPTSSLSPLSLKKPTDLKPYFPIQPQPTDLKNPQISISLSTSSVFLPTSFLHDLPLSLSSSSSLLPKSKASSPLLPESKAMADDLRSKAAQKPQIMRNL
ncbi:hypothetical protein AMTRI_Chr09g39480 [Amborella trichopoda]